jgi:hypothetical protein
MRDDDYVPINGQVTFKEKEALESQAEQLGYIHGRKGSIFLEGHRPWRCHPHPRREASYVNFC